MSPPGIPASIGSIQIDGVGGQTGPLPLPPVHVHVLVPLRGRCVSVAAPECVVCV